MRKRGVLLAVCCLWGMASIAQVLPAAYAHKLSPRLAAQAGSMAARQPLRYLVYCRDEALLRGLAIAKKDSFTIHYSYGPAHIISTYPQLLQQYLLPQPSVYFIDKGDRAAKEEAIISGFDNTANHINA